MLLTQNHHPHIMETAGSKRGEANNDNKKIPDTLLSSAVGKFRCGQCRCEGARRPIFKSLKPSITRIIPAKASTVTTGSPSRFKNTGIPRISIRCLRPSRRRRSRAKAVFSVCHQGLTPGAYHAWRNSTHANLDKIRRLPETVSRSYKKRKLAEVEQDAKKVVQALYNDGLLTDQQCNRPALPKPESDAAGGFFQLFWAQGNNPSRI